MSKDRIWTWEQLRQRERDLDFDLSAPSTYEWRRDLYRELDLQLEQRLSHRFARSVQHALTLYSPTMLVCLVIWCLCVVALTAFGILAILTT